jgi:hypothetical protein
MIWGVEADAEWRRLPGQSDLTAVTLAAIDPESAQLEVGAAVWLAWNAKDARILNC